MIVDKYGNKFWYINDLKHREDCPAEEWVNGSTRWYLNGQRHRIDGPAEEWATGDKIWWLNGKRHREDGPAAEWANGSKYWYLNGDKIIQPDGFDTMEAWFEYLNDNEEESYQVIADYNFLMLLSPQPSAL